jgi:predicted small secreted protein
MFKTSEMLAVAVLFLASLALAGCQEPNKSMQGAALLDRF